MEPMAHNPEIWRNLADAMAALQLIEPATTNRMAAELEESFHKAAQPLPPPIDE